MTEPAEPAEPLDPDTRVEVGDAVANPVDGPLQGLVEDPVADPADPAPRRYPSTVGGAFYLLVLATAATALGIVMSGDWRVGVRVLSTGLAAAGVLRLVLPHRDAGMLAVRHRFFDVTLLVAVAAVLWWLAGSIPDQPAP